MYSMVEVCAIMHKEYSLFKFWYGGKIWAHHSQLMPLIALELFSGVGRVADVDLHRLG